MRRLAQEDVELLTAEAQRGRFARSGRGVRLVRSKAPAGGISGGGQGRRHRRQQHAARRIHLRQPDHRDQCDPRRARQRRREADVSRLVLHLSEARAAAAARGFHADGAARADQRALRDRQDRRHQDGRGLSQPVWLRLHQCDADQSVRPGDNYHPEYSHVVAALIRRFHEAKLSGAPMSWSGAPARRAGNSSMSTTWRTPASI